VAIAVESASPEAARWFAWWMPPLHPAPGRYEFVVERTTGGPELRGEASTIGP
jgi:hypothetical protein